MYRSGLPHTPVFLFFFKIFLFFFKKILWFSLNYFVNLREVSITELKHN